MWHDSELKKVFKYLGVKNPEADNQARHLANVDGWSVILGSRQSDMRGKEFKFRTLKKPHPEYIPDRRDEGDLEWEQLLDKYNYRCPLTGKKHKKSDPLHKGHMDPRGTMDMENVVPMDPDFNRAIKDKFILNEKAVPKKATPQHTLDCLEEYLESGEIDESEIRKLLNDD